MDHQLQMGLLRRPVVAIHERVWEKDSPPSHRVQPMPQWTPRGTYTLLGTMVGVYVLQWLSVAIGGGLLHAYVFAIGPEWWLRPWTLVTSTMAHSLASIGHILINGLVLFFFGPILERILGIRKFLTWFFVSGALAGIVQTFLSPNLALGASGAIMMVFGALVVIMPKEKILVYGIVPVPFWVAGIGYALLDIFGALGPANGIGNFAHLAGMAIGLWLGWDTRTKLAERGMRF